MTRLKIYTKTGDDGTTGLFSWNRVQKYYIRIKTYGTFDELNVWIGMIRNFEMDKNTQNTLIIIQQELMSISTQLADDWALEVSKKDHTLKPIDKNNVIFLENQIDLISKELPELKNFVIEGGHCIISYTHFARCSCRKVERLISELRIEKGYLVWSLHISIAFLIIFLLWQENSLMTRILVKLNGFKKKNRGPLLSNSLKNLFLHKFLYLCIGH